MRTSRRVGISELLLVAFSVMGASSSSWGAPQIMPGTNNAYEYIPGTYTYAAARAEAHSRLFKGVEGHLVTLTSQAEHDFVMSLGLTGTIDAAWMGASDAQEEGVWRWIEGPEAGTTFWTQTDGTVTFSLWHPGEPNDFTVGEDYAVLNWDYGALGLWNDTPASRATWVTHGTVGYVVEFENVPEPTSLSLIALSGLCLLLGAKRVRRRQGK